jgi:diguanylate cyclase (GGDEF)-like protein/PAS domain S-box-containing protein
LSIHRPPDSAGGSPVAEQSLRAVIRENLDGMLVIDRHGVVLFANPAAERLLSQPARALVGTRFGYPLVPGTSSEIDVVAGQSEIDVVSGQAPRTAEMRVVEIEWEREPAILASLRDITDRKRAAENDLREAEERFRRAFDEAPIGMAMLDLELRFVEVNDALCEITGYPRELLEATSLSAITHPDDLAEQERQTADALSDDGVGYRLETRLVRAGQRPVWVAMQTTLLRGAEGHPLRLLAQIQDITDRRRYEDRLRYLADHDPLTGLLNRRSFERQLQAHSALTERYGDGGAAIVLDLDHFKVINDTLGHSAGDDTLTRAANVLRSRLRDSDVLARLGGDEFAVLLQRADAREARLVAQQLLESLRAQTVDLGGRPRSLAASAGIALFGSEPGLSGEGVLANADLAMYDAKHAGRDRAELYASAGPGDSRMKGRVTWAQRIGHALQHDGFVLLAQPIVDLATGHTSQYELLLRMREEHGNLGPPAAFLPIAERLGMVQEIDRWVTEQAVASLAQAHGRGEQLVLEVNLSGLSIGDPELLALINRELERTNVPARSLIFEVTETAAIINVSRAEQFASDLTRLGCRFALDDFGAGYGSFYYLKHIPFDFLKIDGEFVKSCNTSQTDRLLIKAVVDIATGMGKQTIAEVVEDEQTTRLVTELGVNYGQGFHLGRPSALTSAQPAAAAKIQPPPTAS